MAVLKISVSLFLLLIEQRIIQLTNKFLFCLNKRLVLPDFKIVLNSYNNITKN